MKQFIYSGILISLLGSCIADTGSTNATGPCYTYQDDASWAIRTSQLSSLLGADKQVLYDKFMNECISAVADTSDPAGCKDGEAFRFRMNRMQPKSVRNYTQMGYQKIRAPTELFRLIRTFYEDNKGKDGIEWQSINTYHNMWEVPPTIMQMNQPRFKGGGSHLQNQVWTLAKEVLEEWSAQELSPVSLYGIRIYHNASILAPHVDRFPLVVSAIINVDQQVNEPWPLEVYGHDGKATNVTMLPGDMVLYESHSVIHGRPFPLNGDYFANVFVHFEPVGPLDPKAESFYDPNEDLPPYLMAGTEWADEWRKKHPNGWRGSQMDGRTAAKKGDAKALKRIAKDNPSSFLTPDENGWTAFHEAVRSGDRESVEVILESVGADKVKNRMTFSGMTPLGIARTILGDAHEVTKVLMRHGAVDKNPKERDNKRTKDEL